MNMPSSEWMTYELELDTGKTTVWRVHSRHGGLLGKVKWFGRWRQYAFFPEAGCVFNGGCMNDLVRFIGWLMAERRR